MSTNLKHINIVTTNERSKTKLIRIYKQIEQDDTQTHTETRIVKENRWKGMYTIDCRMPNKNLKQKDWSFKAGKLQWKIGKRTMMVSRVLLLNDTKRFLDSNLTISHLCHQPTCIKAKHITFEGISMNQSRSGCAGPGRCLHNPECIRPGNMVSKVIKTINHHSNS